jgi:hypothetical protein
MNQHLLQVELDVDEYLAVIDGLGDEASYAQYGAIMPAYKVAECPLCQTEMFARLDTYSLREWITLDIGGFNPTVVQPCAHFVTTQYFINLNNYLPTDQDYFDNQFEVPYVVPHLLKDMLLKPSPEYVSQEMHPKAVMHALPLCRIEDQQFVPRYTLFTMVYFAEYPEPLRTEYIRQSNLLAVVVPPEDVHERREWEDLGGWVQAGKLYWLDINNDLRLQSNPEAFPYGKIQGYRQSLIYYGGKIVTNPVPARG